MVVSGLGAGMWVFAELVSAFPEAVHLSRCRPSVGHPPIGGWAGELLRPCRTARPVFAKDQTASRSANSLSSCGNSTMPS